MRYPGDVRPLPRCPDGKHMACKSLACQCLCHGPYLEDEPSGPSKKQCQGLYDSGLSLTKIATMFACDPRTVRARVSGIRPRGRYKRKDVREILRRRLPEGISVAELARQEGYDRSYMYRILRQLRQLADKNNADRKENSESRLLPG
jgi:hypothetical protein